MQQHQQLRQQSLYLYGKNNIKYKYENNNNHKHNSNFLEQALNSIFQSNTSFEYEVLVVDNYSADGSVEMLIANFPQVKVFAEKQNHGFSKGNNIAIKKSKGEFVLLLNPETVLEEDTLEKVVEFMDKHKDVGGLGVKNV